MPHSVLTIIGIMIGSRIAVIEQRAPLQTTGSRIGTDAWKTH